MKIRHVILASSAFVALGGSPANAQTAQPETRDGGLEDIVVTAQKRSENLQKVPISISAISEERLQATGIRTTQDLPIALPGLQVLNVAGAITPRVHGIGTTFTSAGFESPVATYVDGVYLAFGADVSMDLSDATQVAVLKGPQGTLFGRNATGGVLQVTTREPEQEYQGLVQTSLDNYLTTRANLFVTGGLGENVAASLSASYAHQGEGYGTNVVTGNDTYRLGHAYTVRGKLKIDLRPDTTLLLSGDYSGRGGSEATVFRPFPGTNTTSPVLQPRRAWDTASSVDADNRYHGGGASLRLEHQLGTVKLTSLSAYRDAYHSFNFTPVPTAAKVLDVYVPETSRQFTQELQLSSTGGGPLVWTIGGFYYHNRATQHQVSTFGAAFPLPFLAGLVQEFPGRQTTDSEAVFAQATYSITPHTRLTGGVRYTWEKKSYAGDLIVRFPGAPVTTIPGSADLKFGKPTWRLSIDQDLAEQVSAYASYNRGVKSGGFNLHNPVGAGFDPERLDAYEVGIKSELADRRVRLNVSGFYYDYSNIQVVLFPGGSTEVVNGPKAELYGIDADFEARVSDRLRLNASANWLHAKFLSFPNAEFAYPQPGGEPGPTINASAAGKDIPYAPHFTYVVGATYTIPMGDHELAFNATDSFNSGFYGEANNFLRQPSYHFINASVAWQALDKGVTLRLFVNNILNEAVASQIATLSGLSYIADYTNPPRTIGGSIRVAF